MSKYQLHHGSASSNTMSSFFRSTLGFASNDKKKSPITYLMEDPLNAENEVHKKEHNYNSRKINRPIYKPYMTGILLTIILLILTNAEAESKPVTLEKGGQVLVQRKAFKTSNQEKWLKASPQQRIEIAEEIGEDGARRLARSKGWVPLLEEGKKMFPQGPDQIYRGSEGIVHVVEAKGGGSQLGHAYGYPQGTPEWAVKSAERIVMSQTATDLEKKAAMEVIEAAAKGKMEIHVIRTRHVLGEPGKPVIEQSVKCTKQASEMARLSLGTIAMQMPKRNPRASVLPSTSERRVANKVDDTSRAAAKVGKATGKAASTFGKAASKAAKIAGPAGLVIEAGVRGSDVIDTERKFQAGEITEEERRVNHAENAGGLVGGVGGAACGAAAGAAIGAPFGGIGAVPGAVIGGVIGGIAGGVVGDTVGGKVGAALAR